MNKLNTENWYPFSLDSIFVIYTGGDLILSNTEAGEIPVISHTYKNNGISKKVAEINKRKLFDYNKTISLADRGTFRAYVQLENFYIGTRVKALELKNEYSKYYNKNVLIFLAMIINIESFRFCYGRNACNRTSELKIKLPYKLDKNENYTPDFDFIDNFIKKIWNRGSNLKDLPSYFFEEGYDKACWYIENFDPLKFDKEYKMPKYSHYNLETKYAIFKLSDLFQVKGTKTTKKDLLENYGDGDYPYITTKGTNNGVDGYYNFYTEDGNVITIDSATGGFCFYQKENFSASDHVEKLIPKFELNASIAIYIMTVLSQELFRYDYGRKFNQVRIKKTDLKLPSIDGGNNLKSLNLKYMERYIENLDYSSSL